MEDRVFTSVTPRKYLLAEGIPVEDIHLNKQGKTILYRTGEPYVVGDEEPPSEDLHKAIKQVLARKTRKQWPEDIINDFIEIRSAEDCVAFANRYGDLGYGEKVLTREGMRFGAPVEWWLLESRLLREAFRIWEGESRPMVHWVTDHAALVFPFHGDDEAHRPDTQDLDRAIRDVKRGRYRPVEDSRLDLYGELPTGPVHIFAFRVDIPGDGRYNDREAISGFLANLANRWLTGEDVRIGVTADLQFRLKHKTLIGWLWGNFAEALIGMVGYRRCRVCASRMDITGRRKSKHVCDKCSRNGRQARYRAKLKKKAQQESAAVAPSPQP